MNHIKARQIAEKIVDDVREEHGAEVFITHESPAYVDLVAGITKALVEASKPIRQDD